AARQQGAPEFTSESSADPFTGVQPLIGLTPHLDLQTPAKPKETQVLHGHIGASPGSNSNIAPQAQTPTQTNGEPNLFSVISQLKINTTRAHSASAVKKAMERGSSLANFMLDLRGFDFSKEGANVILDEKIGAKNEMARQYLERAALDQKELSLCNGIFKLADSSRLRTRNAVQKRNAAIDEIQAELGANETSKLVSMLCRLETQNARTKWGSGWDVSDRESKAKEIFESAVASDPVITDLKDKLHKFNHRSKLMQFSAKLVYSTRGVASFTPSLAAPIAETTLLAFMMATGGPEQDKLLKELYLGKCLESRYRLIAEKTNLVAECYNRAEMTHNPALLSCAHELVANMAGDLTAQNVFDDSIKGLCQQRVPQTKLAMPATVTQ
ncbi:MAG: hypothetical protein ACRD3W_11545, partial [Terriglobales bacterium]